METLGGLAGDQRSAVTPPANTMSAAGVLAEVRALLATYVFHATDEADLQAQVAAVLETCGRFQISREVRVAAVRGRYDIFVKVFLADQPRALRLVLELKVAGTAADAERQAQRYARDEGVDAVVVVTSSQRLARGLMAPCAVGQTLSTLGGQTLSTLGGKPFAVITLRSV